MTETSPDQIWKPLHRLVIIAGNYGSGKTEIAVNLAMSLAAAGARVRLADLDIVNLYFRSREAQALLEAAGVDVVVPEGAMRHADAPVILPQVRAMVSDTDVDYAIFDVGGNDVGARVLSSLHDVLSNAPAQVVQVINARRPFTSTKEECVQMIRSIEQSGRVRVTDIVSNTHLMDETQPAHILEGVSLARDVAAALSLRLAFVSAPVCLASHPAVRSLNIPVMPLTRRLTPPWAMNEAGVA
jgi:phosphohistidine swiveling domain-containing protein